MRVKRIRARLTHSHSGEGSACSSQHERVFTVLTISCPTRTHYVCHHGSVCFEPSETYAVLYFVSSLYHLPALWFWLQARLRRWLRVKRIRARLSPITPGTCIQDYRMPSLRDSNSNAAISAILFRTQLFYFTPNPAPRPLITFRTPINCDGSRASLSEKIRASSTIGCIRCVNSSTFSRVRTIEL